MKSKFWMGGLVLLAFVSCQKDGTNKHINGLVQKGPFTSGTTITIQELDNSFNPSGESYTLTTNDDTGSFALQSEITAGFVEIIATGYYYNEIDGKISDEPVTLSAISSLKNDKTSNVNILTTLARNRILYLIKNQNMSFHDAKKQSEHEILDVFKINEYNINFNELDISKDGKPNAVLLAVSAIMQGKNTAGKLSELISGFNSDFEPDGIIQSQDIINEIINNATGIEIHQVHENLKKRYSDLNINVNIPPFELYVKRLCPLMVTQTIPANNETEISYNMNEIKIIFNKSIHSSVDKYVQLKYEQNTTVPIKVAYDPLINQLTIVPETKLLPEKQYSVILGSQIQATDGNYLNGGYVFTFKTADIDIVSKLTVHLLFNGNTDDSSGNEKHAFLYGGRFCKDKKGNENSAIEFLRKGDYLRMRGFDVSTNAWTYSLWIYMSQYPKYQGSLLASNMSSASSWERPLCVEGKSKSLFSYNGLNNAKDPDNIIELNKWTHVTMVVDHKNIKFYIDGQKTFEMDDYDHHQAEWSFRPLNSTTNDKYGYIGIGYDGYMYISERLYRDDTTEFIGIVDNVRFYQRALEQYEIKKIYDIEQ